MPRPYGLMFHDASNRYGAGSYGGSKGMGTIDPNSWGTWIPQDSPYANTHVPPGAMGPPVDPNTPIPDVTGEQINALWEQVFGNVESTNPTPMVGNPGLGEWARQNSTLLLVGGVLGLLLMRR